MIAAMIEAALALWLLTACGLVHANDNNLFLVVWAILTAGIFAGNKAHSARHDGD